MEHSDKISLDSEGLCNIIKACGESGVKCLKAHDIEIYFEQVTAYDGMRQSFQLKPEGPSLETLQQTEHDKAIQTEHVNSQEELLEELALQNPTAYEEFKQGNSEEALINAKRSADRKET